MSESQRKSISRFRSAARLQGVGSECPHGHVIDEKWRDLLSEIPPLTVNRFVTP